MSPAPRPSSAGTYVYCVARAEPFVEGSPPLATRAIGGRGDPVRAVTFLDLAAIVSDSPASRYDIGRENTMAHQVVLEAAMSRSDILPVRFGTVAKSAEQVRDRLLRRKFGELQHLMRYVEGRVELGLKVFWSRERLFAEIAAENGRIRALRDSIVGRPVEETRYQRIQLGQLTEEEIVRRRDAEAAAILATLRPLAVETRVNKVLTDLMILNAAFLVERAREPEMNAQVNALDAAQAGRLTLKYVGPVPPYNFVNVVVYWDEED